MTKARKKNCLSDKRGSVFTMIFFIELRALAQPASHTIFRFFLCTEHNNHDLIYFALVLRSHLYYSQRYFCFVLQVLLWQLYGKQLANNHSIVVLFMPGLTALFHGLTKRKSWSVEYTHTSTKIGRCDQEERSIEKT